MDSGPDSDKTLRDVANSLTFMTIMAAVGVALMFFFDFQDRLFGVGALLAAVNLFAILLEVRGALAPVRVPMEVLQNLEPESELEPQPQSQPKPSSRQRKEKPLKLVVSNKR